MKVLMAAGGTGGHLIPAAALARQLGSVAACMLVTSERPADRMLGGDFPGEWERCGVEPFFPLSRWLRPAAWGRQRRAFAEARRLLERTAPDAVVGFGGYVSAYTVWAASRRRIPTVIHEQNLLPGRANRWLAPWVSGVALSFPESAGRFRGARRIQWTGNPASEGMTLPERAAARRQLGFDAGRPLLLVMGGSQGSVPINRLAEGMWEAAGIGGGAIQLLHLAGSAPEAQRLQGVYRGRGIPARVEPFFKEMPLALAAADLAVGRAGATSIAELVRAGLPAILIPYPHAGGHQRANAGWMEAVGGAVTLEQQGLTAERLGRTVGELIGSPERLNRMRRALRERREGAGKVPLAAWLCELVERDALR
ncbi:MAG: hypothetical protein COV76_01820 [Candidatus Omnitrophica bacterium CG11_big_fil_rev_8_21_14_0_20_64_10]|nr:MAG: hypothetical protein COV76_01820 [Candidatus Omnitrophica bacterium CG11_big_fil_rev_8_21_14_0_20_64_10]